MGGWNFTCVVWVREVKLCKMFTNGTSTISMILCLVSSYVEEGEST